jgi:hypothetical protein
MDVETIRSSDEGSYAFCVTPLDIGRGLGGAGAGSGGWMRLDREVQRDRFPPTPGWVDARGQVDLARFPTRIPVVDAQDRHGGWIDLREEPFFMVPL